MFAALGACAALAWLWFLALGRAHGAVKRLALRGSLVLLAAAMLAIAHEHGLFARTTIPFRIALGLALATVVIGYLYFIRFCGACGRMVRNLKPANCPRCGAFLPRHGMTERLRRPGDDARWNL